MSGKAKRVVVLDGSCPAALAFVRSLGRGGYKVLLGSAQGAFACAAASRYCARHFEYPSPLLARETFEQALADVLKTEAVDAVVPLSDATLEPLLGIANRAPRDVIFVMPSQASLDGCQDKHRTMQVASECGVPVPDSRLVRNTSDINEISDWGYPVVVKDRYSIRWTEAGGIHGGVAYAFDERALEEIVKRRLRDVPDVLVQRYVVGEGVGLSGLAVDGELCLPFQWKRLREKNPCGSGSSARRSEPLDAVLLDYACRLAKTLRFNGLLMAEFKRSATGFSLMEINSRPWGSIQLARCCGIDYPWIALEWFVHRKRPPSKFDYRIGRTCRWLVGDLCHLENVWSGCPVGWPIEFPKFLPTLLKVAAPWYPGLKCDRFSFADPMPAWSELLDWIKKHRPVRVFLSRQYKSVG